MLPRHQPKPGGEMPRALERTDAVANRRRDQRRGDWADAGDRRQAASGGILARMRDDLHLEPGDARGDGMAVPVQFGEGLLRCRRYARLRLHLRLEFAKLVD